MVKAFIQSTEYRQRFLQTSTEVSLRDFGAVGDGLTNDAPALQQALDSLADAGGGTLVVTTGHYLLQTPVIKQFTAGQHITITGAPSATPINVAGNGDGLDLTSGSSRRRDNIALQLRSLASLLMTDIGFVGVSSASTDAGVVLSLVGIDEATIRHCEFYGIASLVAGGAIIAADHTDLKLQQTAFLGCATNSGLETSVVQNTSWYGISVNDCNFVDYGLRVGFYSKTPLAPPYSWVMIGNEAPPIATSSRRERS
jgi:polygalacturonase